MRNKQGFSLLSFLLYLMLFALMTSLVCHTIVSLIIPSLASVRISRSTIALHIASDLFVRDIRAGVQAWKVINSHELIWHADDHDIGWCCRDNRLERIVGIYNLERIVGIYNQDWGNKTTSVVATGIAQATFVAEKVKDTIIGVELTIAPLAQKKPVVCYVAVKPKENR